MLLERIGSRVIKVPPDFAETIGANAAEAVVSLIEQRLAEGPDEAFSHLLEAYSAA